MRKSLLLFGVTLVASLTIAWARPNRAQEKPADTQAANPDAKIPQEEIDRKNPVKPTPEGLAAARRVYAYDCAMCHGKDGGGKGDLVDTMKLTLPDWRDPASQAGKTDGEFFYVISNGRGKMVGEKDRAPETLRWNLVNLVRSFAKKDGQEKPAS